MREEANHRTGIESPKKSAPPAFVVRVYDQQIWERKIEMWFSSLHFLHFLLRMLVLYASARD